MSPIFLARDSIPFSPKHPPKYTRSSRARACIVHVCIVSEFGGWYPSAPCSIFPYFGRASVLSRNTTSSRDKERPLSLPSSCWETSRYATPRTRSQSTLLLRCELTRDFVATLFYGPWCMRFGVIVVDNPFPPPTLPPGPAISMYCALSQIWLDLGR